MVWYARQELSLRPAGSKSLAGHEETHKTRINPDDQQDSNKSAALQPPRNQFPPQSAHPPINGLGLLPDLHHGNKRERGGGSALLLHTASWDKAATFASATPTAAPAASEDGLNLDG